jgi:hypothetical protein
MQQVYLLLLMPVGVGLIILATYFCHSCLSQVEYNCLLIKVDWLNACIALMALYWSCTSGAGVKFVQFSSQWEVRAYA